MLKEIRGPHPTLGNGASKDTPLYLGRRTTNDMYSNASPSVNNKE